ncbi:hypothetical protein [Cyclobacterium xiamenense]|jgi:hypothetical protein|uniref:hypothetical protein n=1 Tax=Cyclobacterium xiamenense TaxID=1297121 RepID=UPI0012B7B3DA|nr:hypothetical protein [Cyclobacterium xiamenense]
MGLALTNKTIDKYFGFLSRLDNGSKKKLIIKLTESIEEKGKSDVSLKDLSGEWEDSRDSDEIIKEIRNSRVNKQDDIELQ